MRVVWRCRVLFCGADGVTEVGQRFGDSDNGPYRRNRRSGSVDGEIVSLSVVAIVAVDVECLALEGDEQVVDRVDGRVECVVGAKHGRNASFGRMRRSGAVRVGSVVALITEMAWSGSSMRTRLRQSLRPALRGEQRVPLCSSAMRESVPLYITDQSRR